MIVFFGSPGAVLIALVVLVALYTLRAAYLFLPLVLAVIFWMIVGSIGLILGITAAVIVVLLYLSYVFGRNEPAKKALRYRVGRFLWGDWYGVV